MSVTSQQETFEPVDALYSARATRWARACRVLGEGRLIAPFRSRTGRRWLVALFILILTAFPVLGSVADDAWIVVLNLIPYAAVSVLLAVATQGLLDRPLRSLDERQRELRRNLFAEPYVTGATVGIAGGLAVAVATGRDEAMLIGLLIVVFGFIFALPSMVLAWRLPADADDDG